MNAGRIVALSIVVCALVGCGSVEDPAPEPTPAPSPAPTVASQVPADFSVTLKRTPCRGTCPVYTLVVHADGEAVFEGGDHVASPGTHQGRVGEGVVAELVALVEAADFFNLDDCYCEEKIFDVPTSVVTVTMGGVSHTVTHLKGNRAPEGFLTLEREIDLLTGSEQWVKGPA